MPLKEMNIFGNTDKPSLNIKDILKDFLNAIGEDYHNEFVVKGCMALNNHFNYNNLGDARQTRDIDLHYYNREDWENFVKHSSITSTMNSKLSITYELIWRRGFIKNPNGDSLKFKAVTPSGDIFEFSVDMNFGNDVDLVKLEESKLRFYSIPVILSDKLTVLSTRIVCRRIKDLLDIYLISSNFDLSYIDLCVSIKKRFIDTNRALDFNNLYFLKVNSLNEILHALDKYSESSKINKDYIAVINQVIDFVIPIYSYLGEGVFCNLDKWDCSERKWLEC